MGKLAVSIVLAALVVLGARTWSKFQLEQRAHAFQGALQSRGLARRQGMDGVPDEPLIRERAEELAREYALEVSQLETSRTDSTGPVGAGAVAADALGELEGRGSVDADGNVVAGAPVRLRATVVEVSAHVRAEGFLCSLERDVSARANFGYALR